MFRRSNRLLGLPAPEVGDLPGRRRRFLVEVTTDVVHSALGGTTRNVYGQPILDASSTKGRVEDSGSDKVQQKHMAG